MQEVLGHGGISGVSNADNLENVYNAGEILTNSNTRTYIGGIIGWKRTSQIGTNKNIYNIGKLSENGAYKGGIVGWWETGGEWTNWAWLENMGTTSWGGNSTATNNKASSNEIKALVSNGTFSSDDWAIDENINNGYPYLKVFDDTSIWIRNNNVNDGEPYLKNNPPAN